MKSALFVEKTIPERMKNDVRALRDGIVCSVWNLCAPGWYEVRSVLLFCAPGWFFALRDGFLRSGMVCLFFRRP